VLFNQRQILNGLGVGNHACLQTYEGYE